MEMFEAIRKKYGRKVWGGRIVYDNYKYYFQPLKFELADDGRYYYDEIKADEERKDLEIVARGILAYYIKTSDEKQIKQLFEDYYTECFNTYKGNKQRKHDIDIMLKSESEIETLFVETMLEEEAWRIEVSLKKLEKYTTDDERTILHKVGEGFMAHLRNRLQELKPDTPPERQSAGDEGANKNVFDKEKLKSLFIDDFSTKGYKVEETHNRSFKVSRFDKLCQRLEMVLEGNDKELMPTNKNIGAIAYMIYCSPYTIPEYQKPKREGERGKFAPLIRKVFDIVGMSKPSDTRANKYDEPTDDLRAMFEDILKRE